ncbi:hypothetical protein EZV62_008296 [Acer yangbiense]|uniref:Uncharacterized protein n=1 Tax=Acer yangbiense TaxID=1000413 RepID=A0A5C7ICZ6_9ROSI|nr:hypothetical protein EZV62_008296 [Acer yangbiense]
MAAIASSAYDLSFCLPSGANLLLESLLCSLGIEDFGEALGGDEDKGLMGLSDDSKGGRIWILSDDMVSFLFHLEMPREMDFKEIVLLSSMYRLIPLEFRRLLVETLTLLEFNIYAYIYTSNGVSLHELTISLSKGRVYFTKDNDDLCTIVQMDGCPRAFHKGEI